MTNGLFDEKSCMLEQEDQKGEIHLEYHQPGTDNTATQQQLSSAQVRLRTLVAHEGRYVGVTLRMVNWPGIEKEMRIRGSRLSRLTSGNICWCLRSHLYTVFVNISKRF